MLSAITVLIDLVTYILHFLPQILFALPCIWWLIREVRSDRGWKRVLLAGGVGGLTIALAMLLASIPAATRHGLSACRLAPAASWLMGYKLYYPISEGPIVIQMYGPLSAIVYLPAVAFSWRPTTAILLGTLINCLLYAVPAIWFLRQTMRKQPPWILLASAALFLLFSCRQFVLVEAATRVTIDSPGIAFAVLAMGCLINTKSGAFNRGLLCGTLVALSIWTKLTFVALLLPLAAYVLLTRSLRDSLRLGAGMVIAISAISGGLVLWFGPELIFQNAVLPMGQPWKWPNLSRADAYVRALNWMWRYAAPSYVLFVLCTALLFLHRQHWPRLRQLKVWAGENPWLLPILASISLFLVATLAYVKAGGSWNNAVPGSYLALLAAITALGQACGSVAAEAEKRSNTLPIQTRIARTGLFVLVIYSGWINSATISWFRGGVDTWVHLFENENEAAYLYAKAHPGAVYFPNHPLSTLLAEGKLYHFTSGLYEVELAGRRVSDEQLRSALPAQMSEIYYSARGRLPEILERLPEFKQTSENPQMPGWVILAHQPPAP